MTFMENVAYRIPYDDAKRIIDEEMIENAKPHSQRQTPMEFLFIIYDGYIDKSGQYDHWSCPKCRAHVLEVFRKLHPFIKIRVYGRNDQVRAS